jgi:hypothetical protein
MEKHNVVAVDIAKAVLQVAVSEEPDVQAPSRFTVVMEGASRPIAHLGRRTREAHASQQGRRSLGEQARADRVGRLEAWQGVRIDSPMRRRGTKS